MSPKMNTFNCFVSPIRNMGSLFCQRLSQVPLSSFSSVPVHTGSSSNQLQFWLDLTCQIPGRISSRGICSGIQPDIWPDFQPRYPAGYPASLPLARYPGRFLAGYPAGYPAEKDTLAEFRLLHLNSWWTKVAWANFELI